MPYTGDKPVDTCKEKVIKERTPVSEPAYIINPRPEFTLDRFVVGESNRDAFDAASALARRQEGFNTFLVTGLVGLGKSHILEGARMLAEEIYPMEKILPCVPAKAFLDEFTGLARQARQGKQASWDGFNRKYFDSRILFIDDMHHFAVGEKTQAQLKAIIKSVLGRGASASIMLTSVWPLVGIISSLKLRVSRGMPVDSDLINVVCNELLGEVFKKKLDPETIIKTVADHFDVSPEDITSKSRIARTVNARHVASYLCRKLLPQISTMELGRHFKKDHSTVIHGADDIEKEMAENAALTAEISAIEDKISCIN